MELPDKMKEKSLSTRKKVLFTLVICLGFLGILEVIGALYYQFGFSGEKRQLLETAIGLKSSDRYHTLRFIPHPYFNYVGNPEFRLADGYRPYNSRGFRQPEWTKKKEGILRIVALGGSTTYGLYSRDGRDVWPALVEKILRTRWGPEIEVLNLGAHAYTVPEIIGVTAMLVPTLSPDIVLIHVGANDAFAVHYPDEGGPDNTEFRFSWRYRPIPGFLRYLMRNSRLIRVLGYHSIVARGYLPGDMIAAMQYPRPADPEAARNASKATGHYFRQNILSLITLVKGIGATPVLMTHPLNPKWNNPGKLTHRILVEAHRRNNRIILEIARDRHITVVDLYTGMRDPYYFIDAIHANPEGMKLKAALIAPAVNTVIKDLKRDKQPVR